MNALRTRRGVLALCGVVAIAWFALEALRPKADWISMECPSVAIPGRPFPIRLQLTPPIPDGRLGVDLHTRGASSKPSSVVAVFQTALNANQSEYRIEIPLRRSTTAETVRAVLYASPDGTWKNRTRSAISDDIRVHTAESATPDAYAQTRRHTVFHLGGPSIVPRIRRPVARAVTTGLWMGSVLLGISIHARSLRSPPRTPTGVDRVPWLALAIAMSVAALAEGTDASGWLGGLARAAARRADAYDSRQAGQQWVSAIALGLVVVVTAALLRTRLPPAFRACAAAVLAAIGLIGLDSLSLHAFDEMAESLVLGIPAIQVASLACATTAFISLARWRWLLKPGCPAKVPANDSP